MDFTTYGDTDVELKGRAKYLDKYPDISGEYWIISEHENDSCTSCYGSAGNGPH